MPDDDSYAGEPPPSDPIGLPPPPAAPRRPPPPQVPQPRPAPPPQVYPAARPRNNGLAVAGMILGILWIYWIGSVLALIFGYASRSQIERSNGWQKGRDMSTAAIVLGWVGMVALGITIVVAVVVASNDDDSLGRLLIVI